MFTFPQHGIKGFLGDSDGKAYACNGGDQASIPGSERFLEEGNGNPLRYSCLENSMDRGAWQATVHEDSSSLSNKPQIG